MERSRNYGCIHCINNQTYPTLNNTLYIMKHYILIYNNIIVYNIAFITVTSLKANHVNQRVNLLI